MNELGRRIAKLERRLARLEEKLAEVQSIVDHLSIDPTDPDVLERRLGVK
jgi:hypothetical protein